MSGKHAQVVAHGDIVCTRDAAKRLRCWRLSNRREIPWMDAVDSESRFERIWTRKTHVTSRSVEVCGLRAAEDARPGELTCYVADSSQDNVRMGRDPMPGVTFKAFAMGQDVCGLTRDTGEIRCAGGESPETGRTRVPRGSFDDIVMADTLLCALDNFGRPHCADVIAPFAKRPL